MQEANHSLTNHSSKYKPSRWHIFCSWCRWQSLTPVCPCDSALLLHFRSRKNSKSSTRSMRSKRESCAEALAPRQSRWTSPEAVSKGVYCRRSGRSGGKSFPKCRPWGPRARPECCRTWGLRRSHVTWDERYELRSSQLRFFENRFWSSQLRFFWSSQLRFFLKLRFFVIRYVTWDERSREAVGDYWRRTVLQESQTTFQVNQFKLKNIRNKVE